MKYPQLILSLLLVALMATFSLAVADDSDSVSGLVISKGTTSKAKIMIGSKTAMVPISFGDGASWDDLKDSYTVDPSTASGLEAGTMSIMVGSDGTATFKAIKPMSKSASKPGKK